MYDTKSDEAGHFACKLRVTPELSNSYRTAHGGMLALLVDTLGSAALGASAAEEFVGRMEGGRHAVQVDDENLLNEFDKTIPPDLLGMSSEISVSYLRAIPMNTEMCISARVLKQGAFLALVQVDMYTSDGKLAATGKHTKFMKIQSRL